MQKYRTIAGCTDPAHPGATSLIHWAHADSPEDAMDKVITAKRGAFGTGGLYVFTHVYDQGDVLVWTSTTEQPAPKPDPEAVEREREIQRNQ